MNKMKMSGADGCFLGFVGLCLGWLLICISAIIFVIVVIVLLFTKGCTVDKTRYELDAFPPAIKKTQLEEPKDAPVNENSKSQEGSSLSLP